MFFQILGASAEFEHALKSERARDGSAAARTRGGNGAQKGKPLAIVLSGTWGRVVLAGRLNGYSLLISCLAFPLFD
jgi:DNA invertase Pin-like site-specific DNA recombinase